MSDHSSNVSVRMGSERNFGLTMAIVFALIALWPVLGGEYPRWIILGIAVTFGVLGLLFPSALKIPNRLWFKFGMILAGFIGPIVMAFVFLIAFVPIGLFVRLIGKDLLSLRMDRKADSYWISRDEKPKSMELQY